jgi:signal peptidase I
VPGGQPADDQHDPAALASARRSEGPTQGARGPGRHAAGPVPRGPADEGDAPEDNESAAAGKKPRKFWRELLTIVVAAAALTLLAKAFLVQVYRIPSASMENTLQVGDRVLVNKLVYHLRGVARGDIVVFSGQNSWGPDAPPPASNPVARIWDDVLTGVGLRSSQTYYIKRVIGLPGDRVACCTDGKVTVNGIPLTESSYVYPGDPPSFPFKTVIVPSGHLWVMGDNRSDSDDSRYHGSDPGGGAVPENEVVGRAFMIIWPPSGVGDLPIPTTFGQAALHGGAGGATALGAERVGTAALGAVTAVPVAGAAAAAGAIGAPVLLVRRRR